MKIYVCVKQVPDIEALIEIGDIKTLQANSKFAINPYDEFAVEEASRIKKSVANSEVICVTVGTDDAIETMRKALAAGADRGILIKSDHASLIDSITTASLLKAAIERDGTPDLILTGKSSVDCEGGQTMYHLAAAFDIPVVNGVTKLDMKENRLVVEREIERGAKQVVEVSLPCVVGASKGLNLPSYPKIPEIIKARKKNITQLDSTSLEVPAPLKKTVLQRLETINKSSTPKILEGPSDLVATELVKILREVEKVI